MPKIFTLRISLAAFVAVTMLFAHVTWIAPVDAPLEVGKSAKVQIGNGHGFPESESALDPGNLKLFAVAPSGAKSDLTAVKAGAFLTADYTVREAGLHRIVIENNRGVVSRTPQGLKPGGRDQNPGATQSMKIYRSAIAYTGTAGASIGNPSPIGLSFELIPHRTKDAMAVTLLSYGKPCAGATISVFWPSRKQEDVGTTGADGKFTYRVPDGMKGQFLLAAAQSEKASAGEKYDTSDYATALYLTW
jgi:uncharacterized GH25 family protein